MKKLFNIMGGKFNIPFNIKLKMKITYLFGTIDCFISDTAKYIFSELKKYPLDFFQYQRGKTIIHENRKPYLNLILLNRKGFVDLSKKVSIKDRATKNRKILHLNVFKYRCRFIEILNKNR